MFGNKLYLLISLLLLGCAEPKYVRDSQSPGAENGQQESKADCGTVFTKSNLCLVWYWEKKPTSNEMGSLIFKTYRLNALDQTSIETDLTFLPQVILWMASMGHGSTPTQTSRVDVGTYRSTNVFFIMPGEWDIRFQVKSATEVIDETQISLVF